MKKLIHHNEIIVPYTAPWSSESEYFIRPDKHAAEADSLFTRGVRGQGMPDFANLHPARQRECMAMRLCGLCGGKLARHFTIDTAADQARRSSKSNPMLTSPAMCATCVTYAFAKYAPLMAILEDPQTKFIELLEWTLVHHWAAPAAAGSAIDAMLRKHAKPVCCYLLAFVETANVYTYENFVKELSGAEVKQ